MNRSTKWLKVAAVAAALSATPVLAQAGGPDAPRGMRPGAGRPMLEALIRRQADLGLTADQVSRLEQIQARLQEQNRPLVEEVRAAMPTPEERAAERERRADGNAEPRERRQPNPEIIAVMEQIRTNAAAAYQEAIQVLTPEQLARVREIVRERRADAPGGPGMDRPGRMRPRGPLGPRGGAPGV